MQYNLEYHSQLDRSHILPNLLKGAQTGVYSQFISDVFISLLLYNETLVINDIRVSEIPSYYAAVAAGITVAVLSIYLDPFAVILFSITVYAFVFNLVDSQINNKEFILTPEDIIFDAIVVIILTYLFDPTAHSQFFRYQEKRHFHEPSIARRDRSNALKIFFIVIVATYNFSTNGNNRNVE